LFTSTVLISISAYSVIRPLAPPAGAQRRRRRCERSVSHVAQMRRLLSAASVVVATVIRAPARVRETTRQFSNLGPRCRADKTPNAAFRKGFLPDMTIFAAGFRACETTALAPRSVECQQVAGVEFASIA
ncbi:MAG: hypothetical protein WBM84_17515, partial [Sedimenticolaceae bacterium]